ncbi:MAG: patatin-like phospholipase family protein [Acidimicrobiia bacterium]
MAADPTRQQTEKLCDIWRSVRTRDVLPVNPLRMGVTLTRRGALFPSRPWRELLERHIPYRNIEDAAVPLRITATEFATGKPVILDEGPVVDAILASTCLPGVWPPHPIGDDHYLDGILSDPVPLQPAIDAADTLYIFAVNAAQPSPGPTKPGAILRHSLTILLFPRIRLEAIGLPAGHEHLRIVQVPSTGAQVALWDMSRASELIDAAYEEAARFLEESAEATEPAEVAVETVPALTVEVDLDHDMAPENRTNPTSAVRVWA